MYPEKATIEIYRQGRWQPAGVLRPTNQAQGYRGACSYEYLLDYAVENAGPDLASAAGLSCRLNVDFDLHQTPHWPAFVLDILPNGYGRRQWLDLLELSDGAASDWPLLLRATAFPPGNLRIAEAVAAKNLDSMVPTAEGDLVAMRQHPGFSHQDILKRDEHFVEYAHQHGIYTAGASDVQGVAPKLLLNRDLQGNWHAEGVLPDEQIRAHWIVKRPRGRTQADLRLLKNESAYMRVARELGLRVHAELAWEEDHLFIPRFDRKVHAGGQVDRYGMESLCSLAGIAEYGVSEFHDVLCQAIARYCSEPRQDLLEYIQRDIVNVVMGNKDNHPRNTAVLRNDFGTVTLAPLFDFAPMYLDPEGIARVCRWEGDAEWAGVPEWGLIIERFQDALDDARPAFRKFGLRLARLPEIMRQARVDDEIIEHRIASIELHSQQLLKL